MRYLAQPSLKGAETMLEMLRRRKEMAEPLQGWRECCEGSGKLCEGFDFRRQAFAEPLLRRCSAGNILVKASKVRANLAKVPVSAGKLGAFVAKVLLPASKVGAFVAKVLTI